MIGRLLSLMLLTLGVWGGAAIAMEVLEFQTPEDQERYRVLTEELRCPKCQNQNLEDSNAGIAVDLRSQIYAMVNDGKSNQEIIDYMVARYGEFVLYRPVHDSSTAVLWYGPFVLLLVGGLIFILVVFKNKRQSDKDAKL
ncbi:cytochrome c-type biogenesis protein [Marinomonas fungiae]|uniref:Cytochrome c-type biogenesis protein n=1 Tax=Marinomonas fungiae TaxID=1137284 RepID=A0A0K6II94_9GAMM|nr:cytochrome c-type biogenesis protein [Marinomonas fungiae]CUB03047.1 Cytochrome c-type biogenesis protein CcmH/NrfF [Marinomonas fungiae]